MNKAVLISIRPKWCELIASGKKTVEVRKTKPKIDLPFKVYIYCTKDKNHSFCTDDGNQYTHIGNGKVIGEFVCDEIQDMKDVDQEPTCLSIDEWLKYTDGHKGTVYGWHISNLVIYDKPKDLSEFARSCPDNVHSCAMCRHGDYTGMRCTPLKRPPQSWCYVEELKGDKTA